MKIIIAGSRTIANYTTVKTAIEAALLSWGITSNQITVVISGGAGGVDSLGEKWARENNKPISRFAADWNKWGKAAGPIRNQEMADYLLPNRDGLIAVWDGKSRGTADMIERANKKGLKVHIQIVK